MQEREGSGGSNDEETWKPNSFESWPGFSPLIN